MLHWPFPPIAVIFLKHGYPTVAAEMQSHQGNGVQKPAAISHAHPRAFRTLFLSDLHLATRACQAEHLLAFLKAHDAATIYLVGDVIDLWRVRRGAKWRPAQTDVVQELLAKAKAGARIIYIPGNHDSELRRFAGHSFEWFEIRLCDIHTAPDGRRFLVMHGDEFDVVMRKARWLAVAGDVAYDAALALNTVFNAVRRQFGMPYWSISAYLKRRVKRAVNYIGNFEELLAGEARRRGAHGVICGHIHHASIQNMHGIVYINTGDWVESGTAVVEHQDGQLEIVRWIDTMREQRKAAAPAFARRSDPIL
jgi:UDP-2,3-diacylglucosamine pyrophosphatase LpxH